MADKLKPTACPDCGIKVLTHRIPIPGHVIRRAVPIHADGPVQDHTPEICLRRQLAQRDATIARLPRDRHDKPIAPGMRVRFRGAKYVVTAIYRGGNLTLTRSAGSRVLPAADVEIVKEG